MNFGINLVLRRDRKTVDLSFVVDEKPIFEHSATAEELDELTHLLGGARASMADEVPHSLEPGARVEVEPIGYFVVERSGPNRTLYVRDPAFGWKGYDLAPDVTAALVQQLGP